MGNSQLKIKESSEIGMGSLLKMENEYSDNEKEICQRQSIRGVWSGDCQPAGMLTDVEVRV